MTDRQALKSFVESRLEGSRYFLVDLRVSPDNIIQVEIASPEGVDLDECVELSRAIEAAFPRDEEDYELEVGSAGLTSPFKVPAQYAMNVGRDVEVLTADGRKLKGRLAAADADGFTVEVAEKVKKEGAKRPVVEMHPLTFAYSDAKSVKLDF